MRTSYEQGYNDAKRDLLIQLAKQWHYPLVTIAMPERVSMANALLTINAMAKDENLSIKTVGELLGRF